MPKNKGRGGKSYKRGKHSGPVKRDLLTKEDDEGLEYGLAVKMLGNARVLVKCFDEVDRIGHIRGKMKKKVWIGMGDLVMCSLREFQNEKCDIILKYLPDEIRQLKAQGEVPQDLEINEHADGPGGASGIEFIEGNEEGESESSDSDSESDSEEEGTTNFNFSQKKKVEEIDIDNI
jgi:translation initiation factor 1A